MRGMHSTPQHDQRWHEPYALPPRARRRVRPWMILVAVAVVALGVVVAMSGGTPTPAASSSQQPTASARFTAAALVDKLDDLYPLPHPNDNTTGCAAKPGATAKGCVALITTDAVSVYEFADAVTAKEWVGESKKAGLDWRQAGRFALAWSTRDQDFTSKEARADMAAAAKAWAAQE